LLDFESLLFSSNTGSVSQAVEQSAARVQRDVFESHRHRIFALAFYMTGNELEAEEILSGTFIQAFQESKRPDAFAIDAALIREFRDRFCLAPERPAVSAQHGFLAGRNVRRPDLEAAVQSLPANERLLFLLRDVEGYSLETIAKLLDMGQPEVRRFLLSARIRLCQRLAASECPNSEAA
jgi:RNA polymerase sigma-70 factor, ECF subfamily